MVDHDGAYKNLFSNPELVCGLLEGFVDESWVDQIDLSTLEKVNGSYVSDELKHRHNDIVWKVRHQKEWAYVYLLIEFQSPDFEDMTKRLMCQMIFDGRNQYNQNKLTGLGYEYFQIGVKY